VSAKKEEEPLIPVSLVPALPWLPARRKGRKLHSSTVFRWIGRGVRGVKLEAVRVGGTLCTTEAALARFFQLLAEPQPRRDVLTTSSRELCAKIDAELDKAGL